MIKRLYFLPILFCFFVGKCQDSTYYNVLWQPTETYRKAGVTQEGIFVHYYKDNVPSDSILREVKFYDSLGRITKYQYYKTSKLSSRSIYFYSGRHLDSILHEQLSNNAKTKTIYQYYQDGTVSTIAFFDSSGHPANIDRYIYNELKQPLQVFTQKDNSNEILSRKYTYRSDHLVNRIEYFYDKRSKTEDFSYLYEYEDGGKKTTRLIDRSSNRYPSTDVVRVYNKENQLIKRLTPYIAKFEKSYSAFHLSVDDTEETFIYLPNGMLAEIQTRRNGQLLTLEKHVYK